MRALNRTSFELAELPRPIESKALVDVNCAPAPASARAGQGDGELEGIPRISSQSARPRTAAPPSSIRTQSVSEKSFDAEPGAASVYSVSEYNFEEATPDNDESPFPEVAAAVANTDDPDVPVNTLRAWTIGILWAILLPGINEFFHFRYPSIEVSPLIAQLLSYPIGRAWEKVVPQWKILGHSLNPGEFTIKEHVLVTIMGGVGSTFAYATDVIATQRITYDQSPPFLYQWLLVMTSQLIGFGMGGIAQRTLVTPASMVWPATLVQCALFNTLHSAKYSGIAALAGVRRERFFVIAFLGVVAYSILPLYLVGALSYFTWVCWIWPKSPIVGQVFGARSGMGLGALTFDWTQISYLISPLATPWWVEANVIAAFVLFYWLLTPILYYCNVWNAQYMPLFSEHLFDNTGAIYNVSRILTSDFTIDRKAYHEYSPPFLSASFSVSYGCAFACVTATLSHAFIYFRAPIAAALRRAQAEPPDIHARLMSVYPSVPGWWYASVFITSFAAACVCVKVWNYNMTIWALVVALVIAAIYLIPVGMITAVTNFELGLNVITELIIGYVLPGRPVAMMMFKTWGYISLTQALAYAQDMKLGHYMKVPPRVLFWGQVVATALAGTVQLGVQSWMFSNIEDMCSQNQKQNFSCQGAQVFSTASIFWGLIGPGTLFSRGHLYETLPYFFIVGAFAPFAFWLLGKRIRLLSYVNVPLMLAGIGNLPPAGPLNFTAWAFVGFIFQYLVRRKRFAWWAKYNYVLSAALDSGTAVATVLIYFCLQFPMNGQIGKGVQNWWGNTVFMNTTDWQLVPLRQLPAGETFGPKTW